MGCGAVTFPPLELYYGCERLTDLTLRISSNSPYPPHGLSTNAFAQIHPFPPKHTQNILTALLASMGKKGRGIRNPTSPFPCLHPSPTASFLQWPPDLLLHSPPAATWPPLKPRLKPDLLFCSTQQSLWLPCRVFSDKTMKRERKKQSSCPF